jgi:hypothetical protein
MQRHWFRFLENTLLFLHILLTDGFWREICGKSCSVLMNQISQQIFLSNFHPIKVIFYDHDFIYPLGTKMITKFYITVTFIYLSIY